MSNIVGTTTRIEDSQSGRVGEKRAVFLDWPVEGAPFDVGKLFGSPDLSGFDLVFADPLQALRHVGAWTGDGEISEPQYVKWGEKELATYLARVKSARAALDALLARGGSLILRANLPKANIRVVKKSTGSSRSYTESVVSALFWLEEMIGRYSVRYVTNRVMKYASELHPLARVLGAAQVRARQALDSITSGRLEHIAYTGGSFKIPAISRIVPANYTGDVWLIPQFEIRNEPARLVEAFRAAAGSAQLSNRAPQWVQPYQDQLDRQNLFRRRLEEIDAKMEALQKQKQVAARREREVSLLTQLLWETGAALTATVEVALKLLGWESIDSPIAAEEGVMDVRLPRGGPKARAVVYVAHNPHCAIGPEVVESLDRIMGDGKLKERAKGIIVGNPQPTVKPEERETWFEPETIQAAKRHDFCLLPTSELMLIAGFMLEKHEASNRDVIQTALAKDLTICDSEFKLNSRRYGL